MIRTWFALLATGLVFNECGYADTEPLIQARGDRHYPPFEYLNDAGNPDGFNIELLQAVAREMDLAIDIRLDDWAVIRNDLEQGRIDMITGMYKTPEREKQVDFSIPFYIANYTFYFREGEDVNNPETIQNEPILAQKSDLGHDWLTEHQITDHLILAPTWAGALTTLANGQGRAAFGPRLQGRILIQQLHLSNLRYSAESPMQAKYCFATARGRTELLADLNEGLAALKTSGVYDQLYEKWFGVYEQEPISFARALSFLAWPAAALLLLLLALLIWTTTLRKNVALKTRLIQKELQERRSAEAALKNSEKNLTITLNSIGDAVISTNIHGIVERMNPIAEQLTGWTLADARGKPLTDVFRLLDATTLLPVVLNPALPDSGSTSLGSDILLVARDGIKRQIGDSMASITDEAGRPYGWVLVFRDMTDQRHLESQVHRMQRMEALGHLAGGLAHEFNNMLGGILGAAELLESSIEPRSRTHRYVELILNTAHKASELTEKLLTFSHKGRSVSKPFDLHNVIRDCSSILSSSLDKRINIVLELDADACILDGDATQIQNMILNLGLRAGQAMHEGGTLTLSTRTITLDDLHCEKSPFPLTPGNYINLRIRDTGAGLPPDVLDHLFESFHANGPQAGTDGFGLAAVYAAVRDHLGSITVYSDAGEGTAFNICLPASSEPALEEIHPETEVLPGSGCILVVDDEASIREIAEYFLNKAGYRVIHAVNGCDGVIQYRKHQAEIDLVLLDMTMPLMNGRDCFLAIREINPEAKVVMVSGFTGQNDIRPLRDLGLAGFIEKPYRQATLSRIVHDALHPSKTT